MLRYWKPGAFLAQKWDTPSYLWRPFIPFGSVVLLHGQGGVSKSQLLWQLLQAIATGATLFEHPVVQGEALLLCVDMPERALHTRFTSLAQWEFEPSFHMITGIPFPTGPGFAETPAGKVLKDTAKEAPFVVVAIDAIAGVAPTSVNEDTTPSLVYGAFRELFPEATLIFNHHDRKPPSRMDERGGPPDHSAAFLGSANWRNLATSVLHMVAVSASRVDLHLTKSQVTRSTAPFSLYRAPFSGVLATWTYPTWAQCARYFESLLLRAKVSASIKKSQLAVLLDRLHHHNVATDLRLGELEDIYLGWTLAREHERIASLTFAANGAAERT